jgi:hypothetical protein
VQSGISYTLTDNVEYLGLTGFANNDGTGNLLPNQIIGNPEITDWLAVPATIRW